MSPTKSFVWMPDKDKLKGGPKFEMSKWAEYSDSNHLSEVYGYYDEQPAFQIYPKRGCGCRRPTQCRGFATQPASGWDMGQMDRLAQRSQCMIPESRLGASPEGKQTHGHAGEEPAG
jgi:hypothetical protein